LIVGTGVDLCEVGRIRDAIGRSGAYAQDFHDITTGANTTAASPNRFLARAGFGQQPVPVTRS